MAVIAFLAERMRLGFGVDLMIDQLASGLSGLGHDVTVFTCFSDGTYEDGPYRIIPLPIPARAEPIRWDLDARSIARGCGLLDLPFDLWFAATPPFFSLLPMFHGRGVAIECGVSDSTGMPRRQRRNFRTTELLQQQLYFRSAAQVVTISRWLKDQLPASIARRSVSIPLGADHYDLGGPKSREAARKRLGVTDNEVLSLYVGRLNPDVQPYKGTAKLLRMHRQVAELHPQARLALVGFGDDADADWIRSNGAIPVVHAPVHEMPDLFAAADIYVTASAWEGFDLPLVEAQRSGNAVVAFRAGAHPEVVDHGRTGYLVDDEAGFVAALGSLVSDPALRRSLGEAASDWAGNFRWARTVASYDELIRRLLRLKGRVLPEAPSRSAGRQKVNPLAIRTVPEANGCLNHPDVSALILNYGVDEETLMRCVTSVLASTCQNLLEVVVVDNGSVRNQSALDTVALLDPRVRIIRLAHNYGFAGGINRGLAVCRGEYVFILNNDTEMEASAVHACATALASEGPECLAVVPKLLLREFDNVIDAVGNAVDSLGRAFNQGVGQIDIGQYDQPARVFGPCFAAALFRREAFDVNVVGPLDASYFMYYEDIDWNWRANLWGYRFQTAPGARVYHDHSRTTREQPHDFKVRHIHGHLLTTAMKNLPSRSLFPVMRHHVGRHLRAATKPETAATHLRLLAGAAARTPEALKKRRWVRRRQVFADDDVLALSQVDPCLFDDSNYSPILDLENLSVAYRRKWANTRDPRFEEIADRAAYLARSGAERTSGALRRDLLPLLEGEPEVARALVCRLDPKLPIDTGAAISSSSK